MKSERMRALEVEGALQGKAAITHVLGKPQKPYEPVFWSRCGNAFYSTGFGFVDDNDPEKATCKSCRKLGRRDAAFHR